MQVTRRARSPKGSGARAFLLRTLVALAGVLFVLSWLYLLYLAVTTGIAGEVTLGQLLVIFVVTAISFVLGTLINQKYPGHAIGLLFLVVASAAAIMVIGYGIELLNRSRVAGYSPLVEDVTVIIGATMYLPVVSIPVVLMPLYFPTGKLLSPRWRPLVLFIVLGILWNIVAAALRPWPAPGLGIQATRSWSGIPGSEPFFDTVSSALSVLWFAVLPLVYFSVFLRYRRSTGVERVQMKWPIFTVACCAVLYVLLSFVPQIGRLNRENGFLLSFAPAILFPLSMGIAILQYRLFDIDIIIRRTVQYAIVTGVLALVYVGLVITFQNLLSGAGEEQPAIFIVISTLIVAALFNPLRLRVQAAIDRRFYRRKYQAEQALAQFATAARDEVELERLLTALMQVVEETMQPEQASLVLVRRAKADGVFGGARPTSPAGAD